MGSLFIDGANWKIVAPTEPGPQPWGVGGELVIWKSTDDGETWNKEMQLTVNSTFNHAYVRKPLNYKAPFSFFWSSGHAHEFSKVELYFGDFDGNIWKLPSEMSDDNITPIKIK